VHNNVRKILSGAALAGAAGVLLLFASPTYRQGEPSMAGSRAQDFSFELRGQPAKLSDLRGKVVVLNFWATWCPPCVEEMPSLNRLHAQIAPQGAMVLGISMDSDDGAYQKFLSEHRIEFPTWRDPSARIAADYGTFKFPETYIIDRNGRIARKIIGPQQWDAEMWVSYLRGL
jgi:peroxiredoxin